jgi:hypothetical protein
MAGKTLPANADEAGVPRGDGRRRAMAGKTLPANADEVGAAFDGGRPAEGDAACRTREAPLTLALSPLWGERG